jgi:hypothetical protein
MSLSKPASAFTAGLVIVSLAACLGMSAAAAKSSDHKPAAVTHRTHHAHRLGWYENDARNRVVRGDRRLTRSQWSQMPPCNNKYITGVPCITSYDFGCWQRNDLDPVEHCGYGWRPIPLGQQ